VLRIWVWTEHTLLTRTAGGCFLAPLANAANLRGISLFYRTAADCCDARMNADRRSAVADNGGSGDRALNPVYLRLMFLFSGCCGRYRARTADFYCARRASRVSRFASRFCASSHALLVPYLVSLRGRKRLPRLYLWYLWKELACARHRCLNLCLQPSALVVG